MHVFSAFFFLFRASPFLACFSFSLEFRLFSASHYFSPHCCHLQLQSTGSILPCLLMLQVVVTQISILHLSVSGSSRSSSVSQVNNRMDSPPPIMQQKDVWVAPADAGTSSAHPRTFQVQQGTSPAHPRHTQGHAPVYPQAFPVLLGASLVPPGIIPHIHFGTLPSEAKLTYGVVGAEPAICGVALICIAFMFCRILIFALGVLNFIYEKLLRQHLE